jgi:hypothetical protein
MAKCTAVVASERARRGGIMLRMQHTRRDEDEDAAGEMRMDAEDFLAEVLRYHRGGFPTFRGAVDSSGWVDIQ